MFNEQGGLSNAQSNGNYCKNPKVVKLPKGISKKRKAALKKQLKKAGLTAKAVIK